MSIDSLVKTLLSELQVAINSKTVFGEPKQVQNWTIIPVSKVSFGFGAGGGEGKKDAPGFGGGSGGGATIDPVGFLAVNATEVKLISLKGPDSIWEKVLTMENLEKIYQKIMGTSPASSSTPASATSTDRNTTSQPPSHETPSLSENGSA